MTAPVGPSARVEITLHTNGQTVRVAQLGPDYLIAADQIDLPPCSGEIHMTIDGHPRQWPVELPHGLSTHCVRTVVVTHAQSAKQRHSAANASL